MKIRASLPKLNLWNSQGCLIDVKILVQFV